MERVEKKLKREKQKPPIFLLFLLIFILVVLFCIYKIGLNFEPVAIIEYEGYAVTGKALIENLLRSDLNAEEYIDPIKVEEDSVIYKKIASYFVGEEKKTKINLDYPVYVNKNTALLNMTDDIKLITTHFEEIDGYKDSALTAGGLYNIATFERADYNDYLLIKNSDNVYINSKEIVIKTIANTYVIPENSIINFTEEYITYYQMEEDVFKYESIVDINYDSKVIIEELENIYDFEKGEVDSKSQSTEYTYKEFLLKLNIIKENNKIDDKDEIKEEIEESKEDKEENNEDNKNTDKEDINTDVEIKWEKPVVTATEIIPNVYTASTTLSIYDPSGVIKTAIVFEIYKDGKVYMRNQAISSGNLRLGILQPNTEYEIIGKYQYLTKDKKTIQVEFINQKIKTKDISELKPLSLSFENKNIYSNKIELSNLKLNCNLTETSETIAGVRRAELIINGTKQDIKSYDLRRVLSGQTINLQSNENLKSNSKYKFEIKFYDVSNNLVELHNNSGETNTCMKNPTVKISKTTNKPSVNLSLKLKYDNPDKVTIKNQKYVVYSINNQIVDEGEITEEKIVPKNLELAKYYTIKIYGDFDLKDNNGERKGELIGENSFATAKLEDFGDLYIDLYINSENITSNSVSIDFNINAGINRTNLELISMIKNAKLTLLRDGEIYLEKDLTREEFDIFTSLGTVNLSIDKLKSNSSYEIKIESLVEVGKESKILTAVINGNKRFNTLKEEPVINIKNLFILNDTIDFDINIYDKDRAIRDANVVLEVISTRDEHIQRNEIKVSQTYDEYTRIQITDLLENEKYYLSLFTNNYSLRFEEATVGFKSFGFNGDEKRIQSETRDNGENVGVIYTNNVDGDITLKNVKRENVDTKGNLIDVQSNVNWYSECFNTDKGYLKEYDTETKILKLGVGENASQYYLYDLLSSYKEYNGEKEKLEVSFKYKINNGISKISLQNGVDEINNKITEINNSNTTYEDDAWIKFDSNNIDSSISTEQYIGLLLEGSKDSYIEIKEFLVRIKPEEEDFDTEGDIENTYIEYEYNLNSKFVLNLNLYDEKLIDIGEEPNITNGKYYIRIKNNTDNEINDIEYNDYVENAKNDNGQDGNSIENYILGLELNEKKQYEIMLIIKNPDIPEREYILSNIEVDTRNKEIKNISSEEDYLKIQPNGSYIVTDDTLDLGSGDYRFGNEKLKFNGFIDFNGKTVSREIEVKQDEKYKYYLFYGLSENSVIKNLYFDFKINQKTADGNPNVIISEENSGLVYINEGTISNIIVDLKSCTKSPNRKFAIIGYENKGTLENFVIYLGSNFYLGGEGSLGFVYCTNGVIKNGYITPYPNTNYSIKPIDCHHNEEINIAGLASYATQNSQINNVYTLVTINNEDEDAGNTAKFYAGNLISEIKNSTVKNVYSVGIGNITLANSVNETVGPTIAYPYNSEDSNNIKNSYFFYENEINNNNYNTKVNVAALSNEEFQYGLLNSEDSEKQFIINSDIRNYFPKIRLSGVMPSQKNIPMKEPQETDADILLVEPLEDGDTEKLVEITIYNPRESKIDKIELDGLEIDKYRIHSNEYCKENNVFEKCKGFDEEGYCIDESGNRILVEEDGYTQNYISGQTTKLLTKIRIPTEETLDENGFDNREYKSKYNLKSIRAKGYEEKKYFNDDGSIKITNEIRLNYYYQISSIEKWKRINEYPEQNYRIVSDLDFTDRIYTDYCITESFKGLLDGQYKAEDGKLVIASLNNIGQDGTEVQLPLLYKLEGAILSNIMINGYTQLVNQKHVNDNMFLGGLIGIVTDGTIVDNVHMSNVKITTNNINGSLYIGGLIANSKDSIIRNSSVSYYKPEIEKQPNIKDLEGRILSSVTIGGLIGYAEEINISNCFTKNLYVDLKSSGSNGMGGIVGSYIGDIYNCYAIGQINTNISKIGGIFGEARDDEKDNNDDILENICNNCYAMVNIKTESTNLGGIGGSIDTRSIKTTTNNISLGNLYTSVVGNMYLNRIVGNIETASKNIYNYGYANQLINGFKSSTDNKGANYVYEKEQFINNENEVFDYKTYDVSYLSNGEGYLPKLKYKDSNAVLPNQDDLEIFPENPTLEIISAKEDGRGRIEVKIKDENDEPVSTSDISIEIANFDSVNIEERIYDSNNKIHIIYLTGNPIYCLDSYEISKIKYKDNYGEEYSAEISVKIDYIQYREIHDVEDWAEEFCTEYSGYRYHTKEGDGKPQYISNQNYKILGDLYLPDIENLNGENLKIPANMEIARLVGIEKEDGTNPTISLYKEGEEERLITFEENRSGLIKRINKEIRNLNFENIKIKQTVGDYTGVISTCYEQSIIENLSFSNIRVEGVGKCVGMIGISGSAQAKDIRIKDVYCKGLYHTGGFAGYIYSGDISNIRGENIIVEAEEGFVGGAIGYVHYMSAYANKVKDIHLSNVSVKNTGKGNYGSDSRGNCVGGIVGSQQCTQGSNYTINNVSIECGSATGCYYVAGAIGAARGKVTNISVYGINIDVLGPVTRVAGAVSYSSSGGVSDAYVEGKEKIKVYDYDVTNDKIIEIEKEGNIINAPRSNQVGGIIGYTTSSVNNVFVNKVNIVGNTYVGGIQGYTVTGTIIKNAVSQDCTIVGNTKVGGIMGSLEKYSSVAKRSLEISNSYTNSKVEAKIESAGGIIGYINNSSMNNATHVSKIYNNYVACSEITAPKNAGGLIGKIEKPVYYLDDNTKYYYGNLVVSNIREDYPIGNINNLQETYTIIDEETGEEITETRIEEPSETIRRLFNSLFYQYKVVNNEKVLEKSKLDMLKQKDSYIGTLLFGADKKNYNYSNIETMFPTLVNIKDKEVIFTDGTTYKFIQDGIELPGETIDTLSSNEIVTFSLKNYLNKSLPEYIVYASDVDKINIEFNEINANNYFKYENTDGVVSEEIPIVQRVYTFNYDFNSDFKIIVGNSKDAEEKIITPENVKKKVSISNRNYYYLQGNTLKVSLNTVEGNFVNLFEDKALTLEGYVYNLTEETLREEKIEGLRLLNEATPISENVYSDTIVEAYYNHSKIISTEESYLDYQMFIKNGNIFVLDGNLDIYADSIIIDAYNNKEYQTVLGKDGTLYDLKENIKYPENFENKNILQMTNNINKEQNEILIMYKDGRIYVFNYITGSVLFDTNTDKDDKSFINNVTSLFEKETALYELNKEEYESALLLQEKLKETPIEVAQEQINKYVEVESNQTEYNPNGINSGDTEYTDSNVVNTQNSNSGWNNSESSSSKDISYTTVYDADTNQYLVYKTSELFNNNKKEEVVSETEKINKIPGLKEYYETAVGDKNSNTTNGIYFVMATITSILIILVVMYKKKNY